MVALPFKQACCRLFSAFFLNTLMVNQLWLGALENSTGDTVLQQEIGSYSIPPNVQLSIALSILEQYCNDASMKDNGEGGQLATSNHPDIDYEIFVTVEEEDDKEDMDDLSEDDDASFYANIVLAIREKIELLTHTVGDDLMPILGI